MKKRHYEILSIILLLLGLYLINKELTITGAVIGVTSSSSIVGILFILTSGFLFLASKSFLRKKLGISLAKQLLGDRNYPKTHQKLVSIARKMGYTPIEKSKHTHIYIKTPEGKYRLIERIPRHTSIKRNTSISILKTLDDYATQVS